MKVGAPVVPKDLRKAAAAYRDGEFVRAERYCGAVLAVAPFDFDACHLMGVVLARLGRPIEALSFFDRALALKPGHPDVLRNRGSALVELGRVVEGVACYDGALARRPDHAPTLNDRGCALLALDRGEEALGAFAKALTLDSANVDYVNNLGRALVRLERDEEALACFEDAVALKPESPLALLNAGSALIRLERFAEALKYLDLAVARTPNNFEALLARAAALKETGSYAEALVDIQRALALNPESIEALAALGTCLYRSGRFDEARRAFERALALCDDVQAYVDRLALHPSARTRALADAHNIRASILMSLERWRECISEFEASLALRPEMEGPAWNLACIHLLLGDFAKGWWGYESRRRAKNMVWTRLDGPEWKGDQAVAGKKLFLYAEQALGDTLQYVRFATFMAARGAEVSLGVHPPLAPLLRSMAGVLKIVVHGEHTGAYDLHAPLMSMPMLLAAGEADLAGAGPYLRAEPARIEKWRARFARPDLKVGLVWQGSKMDMRSIPLDAFAPFGAVEGVSFFSLHREVEARQLAEGRAPFAIDSFGAELDSDGAFLDTAAIMTHLDLIVTSDTSLTHLAGGLGRPVWLLLHRPADWRWMLDRDDSPWYPGHRLFRQASPGEWRGPMEQAAAMLRRVVAGERHLLAPRPLRRIAQ